MNTLNRKCATCHSLCGNSSCNSRRVVCASRRVFFFCIAHVDCKLCCHDILIRVFSVLNGTEVDETQYRSQVINCVIFKCTYAETKDSNLKFY